MRANNGSRSFYAMLVLSGLAAVCSGCGGDETASNRIVGPSPTTLAGDYTLTARVTTDTCGMSSPATITGNIRLDSNGSGLALTQTGLGGSCNTYGASQQNGNSLTQTRTDRLVWGDCTLQVQTTATLSFTGTHYSSIEARHYERYEGSCPAFSPCDVVTEGEGDLCTDCFPGCLTAPTTPGGGVPRHAVNVASTDE